MRVIVCLDENDGMMFHQRRQSRDRAVIEDILNEKKGEKLWMTAYSSKLFLEKGAEIIVEEDCLSKALEEDFCFIENQPLIPYQDRISQLIVYRWNRRYPADVFFDLPMEQWEQKSTKDFKGFSHEKITKDIYVKHHKK